MSDKELVLALPQELIERAHAANLDLRQLLIDTLSDKLPSPHNELTSILSKHLRADEVTIALQKIQQGERVFGLHADVIGDSTGFDDPLPDDFWFGNV